MKSTVDRYSADIERLVAKGEKLHLAMQHECLPDEFEALLKKRLKGPQVDALLKSLPDFASEYQLWYSEAVATIRQLLPDRHADFVRLHEKPKGRKAIEFGSYVMEDYLQGLRVTSSLGEVQVDRTAAIPQFRQQVDIVKAVAARFSSSLFEIRRLAQADLFDSEIEAARELLKNKFTRAAGAVAGVVLEKHLVELVLTHKLSIAKKHPGISDLNNALKDAGVVDTAQWRFIQHLGDLRNLCDHSKNVEPNDAQIEDLLAGTDKVLKTIT